MATILSLLVEAPTLGLEKLLFHGGGKDKKKDKDKEKLITFKEDS